MGDDRIERQSETQDSVELRSKRFVCYGGSSGYSKESDQSCGDNESLVKEQLTEGLGSDIVSAKKDTIPNDGSTDLTCGILNAELLLSRYR